jgi:fermentation-respiration switch protein FrsA (DUF1100 family)
MPETTPTAPLPPTSPSPAVNPAPPTPPIQPTAAPKPPDAVGAVTRPPVKKARQAWRDGLVIIAALLGMVGVSILLTVGLQLYALARPVKSTYAATPDQFGLTYEPVRLQSPDGIEIAGWYVPAKEPSSSTILVLHGYASNKSEMLPRVAFLAARYNLLFIDLRYFGESGGSHTTFGLKDAGDVRAALNWLKARDSAGQLAIYGFGMGGTVALRAAGEDVAVRCVTVEEAYADPRLVIDDSYRSFGPLQGAMSGITQLIVESFGFDMPDDYLAVSLRDFRRPALVIASRTDSVVPGVHLEKLQKALANDSAAEYLLFDSRQHGEIPPDFAERLLDFYGRCLGE